MAPEIATPQVPAEQRKQNRLGLILPDYQGSASTLCAGCGHDSITNQIIRAYFEMGIPPHMVAKMSGIGCSSKTPAYFVNKGHGFNAVHGRMPAIATGAVLGNKHLYTIGVSGDGDTASIGMGQFVHLLHRNVPMIYIMENNGVYGLTKGQFSATADLGSKSKWGKDNPAEPIDCCAMAVELGCAFVARSFSGDTKQMLAIFKAALAHKGTAFIDIVSPCITFNNHEGSTKSYKWAKDHEEQIHEIGFVPFFEQVEAEVKPGETREVQFQDGSRVRFKAVGKDYDPTNKEQALSELFKTQKERSFLTGILYLNPKQKDFCTELDTVDPPLATLPESLTRPPKEVLEEVMERLR
ncbi:MAG: 2-oxoacid:ferredoxin oxidoreductase subunit beta [Planctomycetia bacterium]|nr:2-oxoacid:ferredoxin oxidoreductase subunit beta [Planctomycetia bacterium]